MLKANKRIEPPKGVIKNTIIGIGAIYIGIMIFVSTYLKGIDFTSMHDIGIIVIFIYICFVGISTLISTRKVVNKYKKDLDYILKNGIKLKGELSGFYNNRVEVEAKIKDYYHTFESESFTYDPTPFLKSKIIDVYVNPTNKENYYVDLRFF